MTQTEIDTEIASCKQLLSQSDYEITKAVEAFFTSAASATTILGLVKAIKDVLSDISSLITQRQSWRDSIGELEETVADDDGQEAGE